MNKIVNITTLLLILTQSVISQQAFHNFGNAQIHDGGELGFHIDVINDGTFNQNLGLAGFYNEDKPLTISGTETPQFFDMDVVVDNNLFLEVSTEVSNVLSYIIGHVVTPRDTPEISLDFINNSTYASESNQRVVDGYASYDSGDFFSFPIGNNDKLRPLITPPQNNKPKFKAAYFNEDPNTPSTFENSFDTDNSEGIINAISTREFWDFDGTEKTFITLTWDNDSQIGSLVENLNDLRIVGWSIAEDKWLNLGNINTTGNFDNGTISSFEFSANDFEIITLGSFRSSADNLMVYNAVTPNGDSANDVFRIEGIESFQNNLEIYNRWGKLVYNADNYKNTFNGVSNQQVVEGKYEKLPAGTYFYVLNLTEENKSQAGYIYITY